MHGRVSGEYLLDFRTYISAGDACLRSIVAETASSFQLCSCEDGKYHVHTAQVGVFAPDIVLLTRPNAHLTLDVAILALKGP